MTHRFALFAALAVLTFVAHAEDRTRLAAPIQANDPKLQWGPCPDFMPKACRVAVLNGDPAKRNADVFFKIPAGETIANHTHTSAERMVLVAGELKVTYAGQQPFTMTPGTYAYGAAKAPHTATCAKGQDCVLFIAFEEPVDAHAVHEKP